MISQSFSSFNVCEECVCASFWQPLSPSLLFIALYAGGSPRLRTQTTTICTMKRDEERNSKQNIFFLIRAFFTFIQFMILGTCFEGDYVFRNGVFCQCTLRVIDPESLFKDLKAAKGDVAKVVSEKVDLKETL